MRKEKELDCQCQSRVQADDDNQQNLADLLVCGNQDRVQVPKKEGYGHAETDGDEDPVENLNGRPGDAGDGDPDQVRVAVEGPAFEEVGGFAAEVAEGEEERNRNAKGVAVDQTSGAYRLS